MYCYIHLLTHDKNDLDIDLWPWHANSSEFFSTLRNYLARSRCLHCNGFQVIVRTDTQHTEAQTHTFTKWLIYACVILTIAKGHVYDMTTIRAMWVNTTSALSATSRGPDSNRSTRRVIFIARQHTDVRYWYNKSVRPSVRPSVTFRYQMKAA